MNDRRIETEAFEAYCRFVSQTNSNDIMELALGIGGEAGEVQEWFKKKYRHKRQDQTREMIVEELGDVLFHVIGLALIEGISPWEVIDKNVAKLERRYPGGWVPGGGLR